MKCGGQERYSPARQFFYFGIMEARRRESVGYLLCIPVGDGADLAYLFHRDHFLCTAGSHAGRMDPEKSGVPGSAAVHIAKYRHRLGRIEFLPGHILLVKAASRFVRLMPARGRVVLCGRAQAESRRVCVHAGQKKYFTERLPEKKIGNDKNRTECPVYLWH